MRVGTADRSASGEERRASKPSPRDLAAAESVLSAHERERSRLAFDLHDGPAQDISAALLQVRLLADATPEEWGPGLDELNELLNAALDEMYELIEQLHSRSIDREGLVDKITAQLEEFGKRSGVAKTLTITGSGDGYSPSLQIAVFRIIQEALSNVRQHAEASNVHVSLDLSEDVVDFSVEDDGRGFDESALGPGDDIRHESYGLSGMRERAALLGGTCDIVGSPGSGTKVHVWLPVWRGE